MYFDRILIRKESAISNLALSLFKEARFSRLAERAEWLGSTDVGISGDRVMQLLVSDLLLGVFDPPDIEPVRSQYGGAQFRNAQTIAIPDLSLFDARLLCVGSSGMADFDYRCGTSWDVALTLHQVRALAMDTPKHLTSRRRFSGLNLFNKINTCRLVLWIVGISPDIGAQTQSAQCVSRKTACG